MDGNLRDAFVISICVFPTWLSKSQKGESDFPKTRSMLFFLEIGLSEQIKLFHFCDVSWGHDEGAESWKRVLFLM